jgi:hypothetical protein
MSGWSCRRIAGEGMCDGRKRAEVSVAKVGVVEETEGAQSARSECGHLITVRD